MKALSAIFKLLKKITLNFCIWVLILYTIYLINFLKISININNACSTIAPAEESVTIEQFQDDISKILYSERLSGTASFETFDELTTTNSFNRHHLERLGLYEEEGLEKKWLGSEYFLIVDCGTSVAWETHTIRINHNNMARSIVKIWLYINKHQLPTPIEGFYFRFNFGMGGREEAFLTTEDFNRLYSKVYLKDLSEKELIRKLSAKLIEDEYIPIFDRHILIYFIFFYFLAGWWMFAVVIFFSLLYTDLAIMFLFKYVRKIFTFKSD